MYRRTARTVLGALRISAEELSFLITARALTVVTVRQTGGSSIVAGGEGAALTGDDRTHRQSRARGVFGPEFCHTHQRVVSARSEEHTSELQSLMRISYAVFCLKKKKHKKAQGRPHYKTNNHTPH